MSFKIENNQKGQSVFDEVLQKMQKLLAESDERNSIIQKKFEESVKQNEENIKKMNQKDRKHLEKMQQRDRKHSEEMQQRDIQYLKEKNKMNETIKQLQEDTKQLKEDTNKKIRKLALQVQKKNELTFKLTEKLSKKDHEITTKDLTILDLKKSKEGLINENKLLNNEKQKLIEQVNKNDNLEERLEQVEKLNIEANKQLQIINHKYNIVINRQQYPVDFFIGFFIDFPRFFRSFGPFFKYYFNKSEKSEDNTLTNTIKDTKRTIKAGDSFIEKGKKIYKGSKKIVQVAEVLGDI